MRLRRFLASVSAPVATVVAVFLPVVGASAGVFANAVRFGGERTTELVLVAQSTAVTTAQDPTKAAPAPVPVVDEDYRIGPEDVLQISVWKNEAMSRTVAVRPDGKISLPLLNDVIAAGLTPMELRDILINKLTEYMPNPEVSVILVEAHSFKVSVMGEVPRPGRYELRSRTTVLDVLALAGGLSQFAARRGVVVLRPDGKAMKRIPFNYNKAVSAGGEQENFYLQAGDIVVVP